MCYERPGGQINRIQRHKKGLLLFRIGSVCLLLCTFFAFAFGQVTGLSIGYYSSEDGLPNKYVADITQDDYGFMWIATRNGLVRFDGYRFDDYTSSINPGNQLKGHIIYAVEKDRHGKIWVGYDEGLAILDPFTGKATHITLTGYDGIDKRVLCISIDRRGRLLLSMENDVLLCYDEDFHLQFTYPIRTKEGVLNHSFPVVLDDTDGSYWIPSERYGVEHFSADGIFIEHFQIPESTTEAASIKTLTSSNGIVYSFYLGQRSAIQEVNPYTPVDNRDKFLLRSYSRPFMIPDRKGNSWIVQKDSITLKGPGIEKPVTFSLPYTEEFTYDHAMMNVYVSSDNTLWAVNRKGIFHINYKPNPFTNYLSKEALGLTEFGISIRGMAEDKKGNIWIGSYPYVVEQTERSCNLTRIDPKSNQIEPVFLYHQDSSSFNAREAPAYKLFPSGPRIWVSSGSTSIYTFDPESLRMDHYTIPEIFNGGVTAILAVNDSTLFFSARSASGIFTRSSRGEGRFKRLYKGSSGTFLDGINNFFDAGNGLIWAGANSGLYLLNTRGEIKRAFTQEDPSNVILPALDINWVYPNQPIWLGSRHGLMMLDTLRGVTRLYTTEDGLPNNNVMSILPDEFGSLWLSTDRGLCRFHPEHNSFVNFDVQDGLPHNEFNRMAALKSSEGRLYFGSLNGVTAFYPKDVDANLDELMPLLTHYSFYQGNIDTTVTLSMEPSSSQKVEFNYHDRLFRFHFMLPAYRQSEKNRFLYKLEGWDKEWQSTNNTHTISYNSIQPGKYTLRVRGAAAGYSWSEQEYRLSVIVRQAWYKTWWSICLGVVVIGFLFYAVYRNRLNALMRVQQVRNKISADLHDELGSVLTQIALQSDMVSRDIYSESEKQKELENIRDTSRDAIHAMSDIVWSISAGHDKTSSLLDRMRDHADLMLQPLHIQPSFSVTGIDESKTIDNILRQELFLIFKEAVHNIVKHSHPGYVDIRLSNQSGEFEMRIRNDINKQSQQKVLGGHGLENMRRRAATIQGTLSIRASANEFEVVLKRKEI